MYNYLHCRFLSCWLCNISIIKNANEQTKRRKNEKEKETEQYIILRETGQIIIDYSTGKWKQATTFHIIDKATGNIYTAQELNEEIEKYNEMLKALNEIEEENEEKGE